MLRRARILAPLATLVGLSFAFAQRRPPPPSALFRGGAAPVVTGPAPSPLRGLDADDCAACHAAIAAEWRVSLHAHAWRDDVFQASYRTEPDAFCRNCHAPLMAEGALVPDARAAREGVSCAVCHVRDGHVLGTGSGRGDAAPMADPHPLRVRADLATSAFCAGCHQFDFPAVPHAGATPSGEPMQDTWGEWSRSDAAARGQPCQHCHMPWRTDARGQRYRAHTFPGLDPDLLRRAVRVDVHVTRTAAALTVRATLRPGDIGHAFPTGDLFRQAELTAWIDGDETTQRVARFTRSYGATTSRRRHQSSDSRIPPPRGDTSREVTLTLPVGARVRWTLDHLRMSTEQALRQGVAVARNRTRVLDGYITP